MKITARTVAALAIIASSSVVAVDAGTSRTLPVPDADDGSPQLTQEGYGPASSANRGFEYGSAELIQLGHGPGGPSRAPLGS